MSDAAQGGDWATTEGSPGGSGLLAELLPRPVPRRGRTAPVLLDVAVGLASIGNRAYTVAVVAYVYEINHAASAVALAASARYLAGLVASLVAFAIVDRVAPRHLLVGASAAAAAALVAGAFAVADDAGLATVVALSALVRALTTLLPPANAALLPTALGGRDLAAAAARQNAIDKVALFAGPAVGAVLLLVVSPAAAMAIVGSFFVAAAAVAAFLPRAAVGWVLPLREVDAGLAGRASALASRTSVLESLGLLSGTSRPTLELLAAGLDELRLPAGTVVVREGDRSDEFYTVVGGEVEVYTGSGDAARLVTSLGPASWFGEIAALTGAPRTATVVTSEQSTLFRIDGENFREALENLPPSPSLLDGAAARLSVILGRGDGPATVTGPV